MEVWFQERRKERLGVKLWVRSVTGAAKKQPRAGGLGTRAGENLTPSQRRNGLMAALGTVQINFVAAWRTKCPWNGAKPSRVILCDHPMEGGSNPKGRLKSLLTRRGGMAFLGWTREGGSAGELHQLRLTGQDNQGPSCKAATGLFPKYIPLNTSPYKESINTKPWEQTST